MSQVSGIEIRYSADTSDLERGTARAEGALNTFKKAANDAGNAAHSSFGSRIQNVGYQVQDFAVQVASGTAATRAFAQQAPQLLSGFGAVGVVLGTVAAVAIPLAGAFINGADAAKALGSAIQTVGPYAATATAALAGFYAPSILAGIATTSTAIGVGLVGSIKAVTVAMMANPLGLLVAGVAAAAVALFAFRDDVKQIFGVDFVGVIKTTINWTIDKFVKAGKAIGVVWGSLGDVVGSAVVSSANIALKAITDLVNRGISGINRLIDAVNSLGDYTGITIGKFAELDPVQFTNNFAKGAASAGSEIGRIMADSTVTDYVGALGELAAGAMSKVAGAFSSFGGSTDPTTGKKSDKVQETSDNPSQESGTEFTDKLKAIQDNFKTERELLTEEYAANQVVLDGALANKLISEQEYYDLSKKLAIEHQQALSQIQSTRLNGDLAAASSFFSSMESAAQSGGKRLLKVAKAAAAAQAIVDTIRAAVSAMNDPTAVTLPQKIANYALVFAKGMAAVAAIRNVSDSGNGGGGGGGGGGGRRGASDSGGAGPAAGPTTTFQFTLMNDPMGFGEKFARQFIDQLNSTQRNGGQIRGVIA